MSLTGVDTSQLISRFTTSESQKEWGDVKAALQEAFPDQSIEELHAAATAMMLQIPDMTMEELVTALSDKFSVEISTELATQIRTEWDEFNKTSGLDASELIAVLDDYSGDAVDTKSQKYLMLLMQQLRLELKQLTNESEEANAEADEELALKAIEEEMAAAEKSESQANSTKSWIGAALAIVGVVAAVVMAPVTGGLSLLAVAPMGIMAAMAVYNAISGDDVSVASLISEALQVLGLPEGVSDVIGGIAEACMVIGAFVSGLGVVALLAEGPRIVDWLEGVFDRAVDTWGPEEGEDDTTTDGTDGTESTEVSDYTMSEGELSSLQETIAQLVKMLKAQNQIDQATLDAIFEAFRGDLSSEGQGYLDAILNTADLEIA